MVNRTGSLRPERRHVPSDSLVIDGGYSSLYQPCRVTLTQTILDIRIHQATVARMSHTILSVTASHAQIPAHTPLVQGP